MRVAHLTGNLVTNVSVADSGYVIQLDELVVPDASPVCAGWTYDGSTFHAPEGSAPKAQRRLTKLEFIGRMTQVEIATILADSLSKPAAMMFVRMLDWATPDPDGKAIDLDDPRTKAGVQSLFNAERTAQILA